MKLSPDQIGIWKTYGAVLIHNRSCKMCRTINVNNGIVPISSQSELDDIIERGFKVKFCKCTKTKL